MRWANDSPLYDDISIELVSLPTNAVKQSPRSDLDIASPSDVSTFSMFDQLISGWVNFNLHRQLIKFITMSIK